jgi:hypothetical protein
MTNASAYNNVVLMKAVESFIVQTQDKIIKLKNRESKFKLN